MSASTWKSMEEAELSRESLAALIRNEIPAIRVRNFATPEECDSFAAAVHEVGLSYYSVARRIGYIGMAQYEYRWGRPKQDYFRDVPAARARQLAVFERSFDALQRLIDLLQPHTENGIAVGHEEGLGDYFAGIIRQTSDGVDLHADYAPFNAPHYLIGQIDVQLAWNFYAQEVLEGGETIVHNAPWTPDMSSGEIPQSYNLPREIVAGAPVYRFKPGKGDVVIFNSRNPHEITEGVAAPGHNRISIGSFMGRLPDRRLVLWA